MSIYVNVVNQKMYVASPIDELVSGSQEFVHFIFNLGDEWDGLRVTAQFKQNGVAYNQSLGDGNGVFLPPDIVPGKCTLMLYGRGGSRTIATTNYITLNVDENIFVSDESVMDATDVISEIKKLKDSEHSHDNKEFLDGLDEAYIHSHDNKEFLDTLTREDYDDLRSSIEYTTKLAHNHPNLNVINLLTDVDIHRHTNKTTLDRLTEIDGVLYLDGNRLGGVVVWHIVDNPVNVPSMDDGTLLFITPGENGDMNYPPYYVNVLGTPVKKIAPWKPGQLWVCRGGVWYLIATANKTEYTPEEVITEPVLPDGEVAAISMLTEADVSASAPTEEEVYDADPCENVDKSGGIVEAVKTLQTEAHTHSNLEVLERVEATDDVVLLPFGEPLDLYLRADYFNLQYPNHRDYQAIGIEVKSTDNRYIGVYGDDGSGVMLRYYDGETITESYNGFQWSNGSSIQPVDQPITDFSVDSFGYFEGVGLKYVTFFDLDSINSDRYAKFIYRLFCQIFNTSTENMGSIDIIDNAIEGNITGGLKWGRTYNITVTGNSYELVFDNSAERPIDILGLENDAYCVVYLTLEQDCDIVHEATYLVNGESPNTTAGRHKWIFNRLPNGQISLGALDLEAVV